MATASIAIGANTGEGAREYVAAALDVLDEVGIHYELTAMATNVEGDVGTICDALVAIHKRCHELGASRVESLLEDCAQGVVVFYGMAKPVRAPQIAPAQAP